MLSTAFFIGVCAFIFFRWPLIAPRIGIKRMYALDTLLYTGLSANMFAVPGSSLKWLSYIVGGIMLFWAYRSGKKYLEIDELERSSDGQSNNGTNSGPTAGV